MIPDIIITKRQELNEIQGELSILLRRHVRLEQEIAAIADQTGIMAEVFPDPAAVVGMQRLPEPITEERHRHLLKHGERQQWFPIKNKTQKIAEHILYIEVEDRYPKRQLIKKRNPDRWSMSDFPDRIHALAAMCWRRGRDYG